MKEKIEILNNVNENISNLKKIIFKIIEYLHNKEEAKGFTLIADLSNEIYSLFEVLEYIEGFEKSQSYIETINEKLNEIVEAIENEDIMLIADLFEYELITILDDIQKKLK
ncbi:hypothetical protein UT300005_30770 [Clostridium sp. CTA-5]